MSQLKIEVIRKFFIKSEGNDDLKKLFLWFNSEKGHKEISNELEQHWKSFESGLPGNIDSAKMLRVIKDGIWRNKSTNIKNNVIRLFPYAAAVALIIGFVAIFSVRNNLTKASDDYLYASVITGNGQRSKVVLPDSSIVWLNSGTTLSYNYSLGDKRSVKLSGQAFFQIARDEDRPLVVQCGEIMVKVLGTRFDVSAYPDDEIINVVLESGSVELDHNRYSLNYRLKPGEKADYDVKGRNINILDVDVHKFTSWKDGKLIFRNDPMDYVIEKLERWYNIDIEVKDKEVYSSIFTGTVANEAYPQIFKLIGYSCPVHCEIVHNANHEEIPKIIISKK